MDVDGTLQSGSSRCHILTVKCAVKFIGLLIICSWLSYIYISEVSGRYGNIMKVHTSGASCLTAGRNNVSNCGIPASEKIAKNDLENMNKYKKLIKDVGKKLHIDPAVIAGVISRETRAGATLNDGWGEKDNTFGLMQIYKENHTSEEAWNSKEHIFQGTQILVDMIEAIQKKFPMWTKEEQLKGGIAAFNVGPSRIMNSFAVDVSTSNNDYASDVVARAKYFKSHGY
ncbi:lysozyme g-like [Microcaecilia unicolor]|uniref:Lysozyme g n=1 Tax=Microcaecilia unicolor TaxID=1415580 RepID=A0A6P7XZL7_9AMPH|nr:lysozyme g-like [Microcaecilia unicolor]